MSLSPAVSLTLGNLRYDTHAALAQVCLQPLPRGGAAELSLPAAVRFEAAPGDRASLDLDGGEGTSTVLTGKLRAVGAAFTSRLAQLSDAAGALADYRPAVTFERQSAAQIIRKLASDVSITVGDVELELELPAYVAHPNRSAAEHIAELARLGGALALCDAQGRLLVRARPSGQPTAALRYGREIQRCETQRAQLVNGQRFAIGFGPAGSASAPDALRPTTGALPADAASGGAGVRRTPKPVLRSAGSASAASRALQVTAAARAERLVAHCWLLPALRPGDVIEVQDLPDALAGGPWLLDRVEHRVSAGRGCTTLYAQSAGASGTRLDAALGAVAAIGGAL